MNERSCNSDRDMLRRAIEKIKRDERHRPKCCMIVGPTGPTGPSGGPTGATAQG